MDNLSQTTAESLTDLQRSYQQALIRLKNLHSSAASRSLVHVVGKINLETNRPQNRQEQFIRGSIMVVETADLDLVTVHPEHSSHQSSNALMSRLQGVDGPSSALTTLVSDALGGQSYATTLGVMPTTSLSDGGKASSAILQNLQHLHQGCVENFPKVKLKRQDVLLKQYKAEVDTMKKKFVKEQRTQRANRAVEMNHKVRPLQTYGGHACQCMI